MIDDMNKEILSTSDLDSELTKILGIIDKLDTTIDKIDKKISDLSKENPIYYSEASIKLYDYFIEDKEKIIEFHDSLKSFISSTKIITETYEDLEKSIIDEIDKIETLKIEV